MGHHAPSELLAPACSSKTLLYQNGDFNQYQSILALPSQHNAQRADVVQAPVPSSATCHRDDRTCSSTGVLRRQLQSVRAGSKPTTQVCHGGQITTFTNSRSSQFASRSVLASGSSSLQQARPVGKRSGTMPLLTASLFSDSRHSPPPRTLQRCSSVHDSDDLSSELMGGNSEAVSSLLPPSELRSPASQARVADCRSPAKCNGGLVPMSPYMAASNMHSDLGVGQQWGLDTCNSSPVQEAVVASASVSPNTSPETYRDPSQEPQPLSAAPPGCSTIVTPPPRTGSPTDSAGSPHTPPQVRRHSLCGPACAALQMPLECAAGRGHAAALESLRDRPVPTSHHLLLHPRIVAAPAATRSGCRGTCANTRVPVPLLACPARTDAVASTRLPTHRSLAMTESAGAATTQVATDMSHTVAESSCMRQVDGMPHADCVHSLHTDNTYTDGSLPYPPSSFGRYAAGYPPLRPSSDVSDTSTTAVPPSAAVPCAQDVRLPLVAADVLPGVPVVASRSPLHLASATPTAPATRLSDAQYPATPAGTSPRGRALGDAQGGPLGDGRRPLSLVRVRRASRSLLSRSPSPFSTRHAAANDDTAASVAAKQQLPTRPSDPFLYESDCSLATTPTSAPTPTCMLSVYGGRIPADTVSIPADLGPSSAETQAPLFRTFANVPAPPPRSLRDAASPVLPPSDAHASFDEGRCLSDASLASSCAPTERLEGHRFCFCGGGETIFGSACACGGRSSFAATTVDRTPSHSACHSPARRSRRHSCGWSCGDCERDLLSSSSDYCDSESRTCGYMGPLVDEGSMGEHAASLAGGPAMLQTFSSLDSAASATRSSLPSRPRLASTALAALHSRNSSSSSANLQALEDAYAEEHPSSPLPSSPGSPTLHRHPGHEYQQLLSRRSSLQACAWASAAGGDAAYACSLAESSGEYACGDVDDSLPLMTPSPRDHELQRRLLHVALQRMPAAPPLPAAAQQVHVLQPEGHLNGPLTPREDAGSVYAATSIADLSRSCAAPAQMVPQEAGAHPVVPPLPTQRATSVVAAGIAAKVSPRCGPFFGESPAPCEHACDSKLHAFSDGAKCHGGPGTGARSPPCGPHSPPPACRCPPLGDAQACAMGTATDDSSPKPLRPAASTASLPEAVTSTDPRLPLPCASMSAVHPETQPEGDAVSHSCLSFCRTGSVQRKQLVKSAQRTSSAVRSLHLPTAGGASQLLDESCSLATPESAEDSPRSLRISAVHGRTKRHIWQPPPLLRGAAATCEDVAGDGDSGAAGTLHKAVEPAVDYACGPPAVEYACGPPAVLHVAAASYASDSSSMPPAEVGGEAALECADGDCSLVCVCISTCRVPFCGCDSRAPTYDGLPQALSMRSGKDSCEGECSSGHISSQRRGSSACSLLHVADDHPATQSTEVLASSSCISVGASLAHFATSSRLTASDALLPARASHASLDLCPPPAPPPAFHPFPLTTCSHYPPPPHALPYAPTAPLVPDTRKIPPPTRLHTDASVQAARCRAPGGGRFESS